MFTSTTVPESPDTEIGDGYGAAGPVVVPGAPDGIVIGAGFEKEAAAAGVAVRLTSKVASRSEHDTVPTQRLPRYLTEG
jgi:hypothetical protein